MIRPQDDGVVVYLCVEPVDFRRQITGLATLVQDRLEMDPFSAKLFVFANRRRTQCRILYWERTGFVLWTNYRDSYYTSSDSIEGLRLASLPAVFGPPVSSACSTGSVRPWAGSVRGLGRGRLCHCRHDGRAARTSSI